MSDEEIPDEITITGRDGLFTYEMDIWAFEGGLQAQTTMRLFGIIPITFPVETVDRDHVRHMMEEYGHE